MVCEQAQTVCVLLVEWSYFISVTLGNLCAFSIAKLHEVYSD